MSLANVTTLSIKPLSLWVLALLFIACGPQIKGEESKIYKPILFFQSEQNDKIQTLTVTPLDENSIEVETSIAGTCATAHQGIARLALGDPEIMADQNDLPVLALKYDLDIKVCALEIYISNNKQQAWVVSDCSKSCQYSDSLMNNMKTISD